MGTRQIGHLAFMLAVTSVLALGFGGGSVAASATMSAARTKQALDTYKQALDSGAPSAGFFAKDASLTFTDTGEQVQGQAAVSAAIDDLYNGAFAGRMTVTTSIIGGGIAATSGEFIGTQIGVFAGLAPAGHIVRVPYTAFYEMDNSRITALRLDLSTAEMLRQLTAPAAETSSPVRSGRPY
jgi:predicted ester cyclase